MGHTKETRRRALEKLQQRRLDWFEKHGPCVACSSWEQLELDHRDPNQKIDHKIWSWASQRRHEELSKCQVLCRSCHKLKTKWQTLGRLKHGGTRTLYDKFGCRCSLCREAQRVHNSRRKEMKWRSCYKAPVA